MMSPLRTAEVPIIGNPTFLGAQIADVEDLRPGDAAMVGLFLDHGDRGRFGKRFAARQIRYASAAASVKPPVGPQGSCLDLGDLNVFPLEPVRQEQALKRQLDLIVGAGAIPIVVGGRKLPFPLGDCLSSGLTRQMATPWRPLSDEKRFALLLDLAPLLDVRCEPQRKSAVLRGLVDIPSERIGAVHLFGVAPDLDVGGRCEASFAVHVLEGLAAHCIGGQPCR